MDDAANREVVSQAGMMNLNSGFTFTITSNLQSPEVHADRVLSKQAVLNVLTNAMEAVLQPRSPDGKSVGLG